MIAVDAGHNLSFVRDHVREFRTVRTSGTDSQFRSRDSFPTAVAEIANGCLDSLGRERSVRDVPPKPAARVCHVDGYGNVKTSIRSSELEPGGDRLTIEIDGRIETVPLRDAVSEIDPGTVAVVPGSAGGDDPYLELFRRGGSAASTFDQPAPGDEVTVR